MRVETENAALPHNNLPLSSLPMYNKNSEQCTGTYASRYAVYAGILARIIVKFAQTQQRTRLFPCVD